MIFTATPDEIRRGDTTDVYFRRALEIIKRCGLDKTVKMEVRARKLPRGWEYGILCGIEETITVLEGIPVNLWCMREGEMFFEEEPVLVIEGRYSAFGALESPILGFLCQSTGIATKASRCKKAAGGKPVISFGVRRMHPAIAPMIERAAFIGGCDGVAGVKSAEMIGEKPTGTMPHSLVLLAGDPATAYRLFNETMPPEVKRIALIDTIGDEKFEAVKAAEALGKDLFGVRLDTPGSRRGDFRALVEEVRWELDIRGYGYVKIFVSGGLDEDSIASLRDLVDAYGVGTAISNAPTVDFSMDIVEIEGVPISKRGKKSGAKNVLMCEGCGKRNVVLMGTEEKKCEVCGSEMRPLLTKFIEDGKVVGEIEPPRKIRERVLKSIGIMEQG